MIMRVLTHKYVKWGVIFVKTAARFRKKLIERYGNEKCSKIRYTEAFEVYEYGSFLTDEMKKSFLHKKSYE